MLHPHHSGFTRWRKHQVPVLECESSGPNVVSRLCLQRCRFPRPTPQPLRSRHPQEHPQKLLIAFGSGEPAALHSRKMICARVQGSSEANVVRLCLQRCRFPRPTPQPLRSRHPQEHPRSCSSPSVQENRLHSRKMIMHGLQKGWSSARSASNVGAAPGSAVSASSTVKLVSAVPSMALMTSV